MSEKPVCPICGEPSYLVYGKYPRKDKLCSKHAKDLYDGKLLLCDKCGQWHYADKPCKCDETLAATPKEIKTVSHCLICGAESNGYHFCKNCYAKYKDHSVDIRIKNCSEVEILDEYGNKTFKCMNNVIVRSRAEVTISDWLFAHNILVVYEPDFFYKENGETKILHPDFYLPGFDVYIEYCELTNKPYLKKKEYTQKIYADNNAKVIIMDDNDIEDRARFFFDHLGIK